MDAETINLNALRRKDANVSRILGKSSLAVIYRFTDSNKWAKTDIEGSLFVFSRRCVPYHGLAILNKNGANDYFEDLSPNTQFTQRDNFLLYRGIGEIHGIWFYDVNDAYKLLSLLNNVLQTPPSTKCVDVASLFSAPPHKEEDYHPHPELHAAVAHHDATVQPTGGPTLQMHPSVAKGVSIVRQTSKIDALFNKVNGKEKELPVPAVTADVTTPQQARANLAFVPGQTGLLRQKSVPAPPPSDQSFPNAPSPLNVQDGDNVGLLLMRTLNIRATVANKPTDIVPPFDAAIPNVRSLISPQDPLAPAGAKSVIPPHTFNVVGASLDVPAGIPHLSGLLYAQPAQPSPSLIENFKGKPKPSHHAAAAPFGLAPVLNTPQLPNDAAPLKFDLPSDGNISPLGESLAPLQLARHHISASIERRERVNGPTNGVNFFSAEECDDDFGASLLPPAAFLTTDVSSDQGTNRHSTTCSPSPCAHSSSISPPSSAALNLNATVLHNLPHPVAPDAATGSSHHPSATSHSSIYHINDVRAAVLNSDQFRDALVQLILNDDDFVSKLHTAYLTAAASR